MNKKKRLAKRFLWALDPVEPKGKPGPGIGNNMYISKKDKKRRGRCYPVTIKGNMKYKEVISEAIEYLGYYWDEWNTYRDGFSPMFNDKWKKYHWRKSDKVKKKIALRKARKRKDEEAKAR